MPLHELRAARLTQQQLAKCPENEKRQLVARFRPSPLTVSYCKNGVALQSWAMHGFRETCSQWYFFWRDRKSLLSNLTTPFSNLLFRYGAVTWAESRVHHHAGGLALDVHRQRKIGEILVGSYYVSETDLNEALAVTYPRTRRKTRIPSREGN
jgi:hypothetical protein